MGQPPAHEPRAPARLRPPLRASLDPSVAVDDQQGLVFCGGILVGRVESALNRCADVGARERARLVLVFGADAAVDLDAGLETVDFGVGLVFGGGGEVEDAVPAQVVTAALVLV